MTEKYFSMKRSFFQDLETFGCNETLPLKEVIEQLAFNEQGLIPVIAQDVESKEVLMQAWMNREALQQTLDTGRMTYWSRSRHELWVKGATSGHSQTLNAMRFDCDGDAVLCLVTQCGAACHTQRKNCFYIEAQPLSHRAVVTSSVPSAPIEKQIPDASVG
jgi:phosphoribosyl-AMP cyclohydrolase